MASPIIVIGEASAGVMHPASWIGMVLILASLAGAVLLGITGIGFHILHG
jgi:hypothetical protein